MAFFVINELQMAQSTKALAPAIIYIRSFIVSIGLQEMSWTGQRLKAYYSAGGILWIFCGAAILILPTSLSPFIYVLSMFIGIANAPMMVTGISMPDVLIGEDLNGCAFVCGSLSFLHKISCGLAVYILQSYQSNKCMYFTEKPGKLLDKLYLHFGDKIWFGSCSGILFSCWGSCYIHHEATHPILEIFNGTLVGVKPRS